MWRPSAVNFSFFLSLAVFRTRSRPCDAPSRLGVRSVPPCSAFPSVPALGSTGSAPDRSATFVGFKAVGSEEARSVAFALTSVRRSNGTCSFPAFRFHGWACVVWSEGISETRPTSLNSSPRSRLVG